MARFGGDIAKFAVPRGQQPAPQITGRYNLPMNPAETIRARQSPLDDKSGCKIVGGQYTDVGMLNIEPYDIVLRPMIDSSGAPVDPNLEQAPFSALNGLRKYPGPVLSMYAFAGVALTGYTYGPLQSNRELAVGIVGITPFVNVCGMTIHDGEDLTVSVDHDAIRIDRSYAMGGMGRHHMTMAAETNKILKPFFAPADSFPGKTVARACGTTPPNTWGSVMLIN